MRPSFLWLVTAALAATGCQDKRSYAVRWRVEPRSQPTAEPPATTRPQDEEMTNPSVCARAGVSHVEVWVLDQDRPAITFFDTVVDVFERPCFPERFRRPGGAVRGGTLGPGNYTIVVAGTRANGVPWGSCIEPDDDELECSTATVENILSAAWFSDVDVCDGGECTSGLDSCDCRNFEVVADQLNRLPDFTLPAPPDCEDGIDGDEDGLVDQLDPGCQLGTSESTPVLSPEIALSVSVLSGNPNAGCNNIGVGMLDVTIDGEPVDALDCSIGRTRFTTPLNVGPHELTLTGIRGNVPVTVEKTFEFEVTEFGVTEPPVLEVDFADVDLLEPLFAGVRFSATFRLPGSDDVALCSAGAVGATDFRYRVLDMGGEPVRPPLLSSSGIPLEGSSTSCSSAEITSVQSVRWGGYLMEFEAYTDDGELCWSNADDPTVLVPSEVVVGVAEPVDGAPAECFGG